MGDISVTSRFARGGLNLGIRFAWGKERKESLSKLPREEARRLLSSYPFPRSASLHSPGVRPGVLPALWDLLAARIGEGPGPGASLALRCQRAMGALGMGASS